MECSSATVTSLKELRPPKSLHPKLSTSYPARMCCFKPLLAHCRMVHDTDIVELELRSKRFSLAVRKKEAIEALEPQVVYQVCLCQWPSCLQSCRKAPAPAALLTA